MNRYYVVYKNRPLCGPYNKEDAETKLAHLGALFQNLQIQVLPDPILADSDYMKNVRQKSS